MCGLVVLKGMMLVQLEDISKYICRVPPLGKTVSLPFRFWPSGLKSRAEDAICKLWLWWRAVGKPAICEQALSN